MSTSFEPRRLRLQDSAFDALRRLLGLAWLLNAGFHAYAWLLPPRARGAAAVLRAYDAPLAGAPAWLHPYLTTVLRGVQAWPQGVAAGMVALDLIIAASLLSGRSVRLFSWIGIAYCLFCWSTLDSFGYPYSQGQTDPGVFVNYAIAFVCVLSAHALAQRRPGERPVEYDPFRAARILFGLLWLVDAVLKWQPSFLFHFTDQLTGALAGQPEWIGGYIRFVLGIVRAAGPLAVAVLVALVESLIALSLLTGRSLRITAALGSLYCLAVWTTAEGWGGPYTAAGTGVRGNVLGNVLIYVLIFAYLWTVPRLRRAGK